MLQMTDDDNVLLETCLLHHLYRRKTDNDLFSQSSIAFQLQIYVVAPFKRSRFLATLYMGHSRHKYTITYLRPELHPFNPPEGRYENQYKKALTRPYVCCGTPYDIGQGYLDQVMNPRKPLVRHQLSKDLAAAARRHNSKTRVVPDYGYERRAFERLNKLFHQGVTPEGGPDMMYKTFRDLDAVFFLGKLFNRVKVTWSPGVPKRNLYGYTTTFGTPPMIVLDAHHIFNPKECKPFRRMFQTLIHEMVVSSPQAYSGRLLVAINSIIKHAYLNPNDPDAQCAVGCDHDPDSKPGCDMLSVNQRND